MVPVKAEPDVGCTAKGFSFLFRRMDPRLKVGAFCEVLINFGFITRLNSCFGRAEQQTPTERMQPCACPSAQELPDYIVVIIFRLRL